MKSRLLIAVIVCFLATTALADFGSAGFPGINGKIVFSSNRDGNLEIYSMNADGTEQVRLTTTSEGESRPVLSPDGTKIVYQRLEAPAGNFEIFVMNADGSNQIRLTENAIEDSLPVWSPDGTKIAFNSKRDDTNADIHVMNADGSNVVNLTNATSPAAEDASPAWSPDGTKIAFHSRRDGPTNEEIYVMDVDGSDPLRLTNDAALDIFPYWSPDGTKLTFTALRDGNQEIYLMNSDGSDETNLTKNPAIDQRSPWSPDGTKIALSTTRGAGDSEIYSMSPDGSNPVNLSNNSAAETLGEWGSAQPQPEPQPVKPIVKPSNTFSFGKFTRNRKKGTATLVVNVPGAGQLALGGKRVRPIAKTADGTSTKVNLKVVAAGKAKKKLREIGKVKLRLQVTFTPTGGDPSSQTKPVKLIRLRASA